MPACPLAWLYIVLGCYFGPIQSISGQTGALEINIQPQYGGKPLRLNDSMYRNAAGDSFSIEVLRLYVGKCTVTGENTHFTENNQYHLLDMEIPGAWSIFLTGIAPGRYNQLSFLVGTDSLMNVSGVQGGDLDPTLGMYWAWNTGYIHVKIEGKSNVCNTLHHAFQFHLGGYLPPYPAYQAVQIPAPAFEITPGETFKIMLSLDLKLFFDHLQLKNTHTVMQPSRIALDLAGYFSKAFHLITEK